MISNPSTISTIQTSFIMDLKPFPVDPSIQMHRNRIRKPPTVHYPV